MSAFPRHSQDILDSFPVPIAVVDGHGVVTAVNAGWRQLVRRAGVDATVGEAVGRPYTEVFKIATGADAEAGRVVEAGVAALLDGARPAFSHEYRCASLGDERWTRLAATPLGGGTRGAIISHADVTGEKRGQGAAIALARVAQAVTETPDVAAVGRQIVDSVLPVLGVQAASLRLLNRDGSLQAVTRGGSSASHAESRDVSPPGLGIGGRAVAKGAPVQSRDVLTDPDVILTDLVRGMIRDSGVNAWLAVPLRAKGRITGTLAVGDRIGRDFSEVEVTLLQTFADQAAVALENARLHEDAGQRRHEAEVIAELARSIGASLDLDTVLGRVAAAARELCRSDIARIALREPGAQAVVFRFWAGNRPAWVDTLRIEPGKGLGGLALSLGRPVRTDDYYNDPRITQDYLATLKSEGLVAQIAIPILGDHGAEGLLYVANASPRPFTEADETIGLRLAEHAAIAIRNARLFAAEQAARAEAESAARAVQASEEQVRSIIDAALDAVITIDAHGIVTGWNGRAETMFGWERDEAIGRALTETVIPERYHAAHRGGLERFLTTGTGPILGRRVELSARHRSGREFPVELTISALGSGPTASFSAFLQDITERQRAETALRESERRFRALIEHSSDAIALFGPDGTLLYGSPATTRILGYGPDELVGKNALALVHPEDRDAVGERLRQALQRPRAMVHVGARVQHKNGSWRVLEGIFTNLLADPSVRAVVTNYRDVTERKHLEDELRQTQKMEAVGQLAGGVAHDFNNLLTVIIGRSQLLLDRLPPHDPSRRDVELMEQTAERAATLTQQLLAFSRRQVLQPKVLQLNTVVGEVVPMLHRLLGEHINLTTTLSPALAAVRADAAQLQQVILNLAVNGRDAMPGGGDLRIATAALAVDEALAGQHPGARPGTYVVLEVTDSGAGMTAEVQARMFEPFFTTKEKGKGTGLGLSTVYGIVQQHKGFIRVQSEPGLGTTFSIYLPRADEPLPAPPEAPRAAVGSPRGTEAILLVEDQDELREVALEALTLSGYRVRDAGTVGEALRLAGEHPDRIDLLLTDVVMPDLNGRELAERILALHPEARVLYMSGYADDAIVHHGVLDAGTAFLPKPFTPSDLARKVREVLDAPASHAVPGA